MAEGQFDFILDQLEDDLVADFAERALPVVVKVGEWSVYERDARPRVILALGDFGGSIGQPLSSRYAPGLALDTSTGQKARTLGGSLQDVIFWVAAAAPQGTAPDRVAREARKAAWSLAVATLGAIWRSHGGAFTWSRGRWLNDARAATNLGAALQFVAQFAVPIPDDPDDVINVVRASASLDIDASGTVTAGPTIDTGAP